jgi:CRP/FNR family transcriptional regulator, polysaccharide utilization system transcription regulator
MNKKTVFNSCTVNYDTYNCFEKLKDDELLLLEKNRLEISFKKGETICKQGSFASHIMYICKGLVKIYVENESGSLILKILPQGNLIGLSSLYDGNNIFQYTATTYTDSVVRLIDINIVRQLIKQNAEFASEIVNVLCENTIQTYGRFFCFTQKQSFGRMADIILCLACRIFKSHEFELNLSRKEIAELSGLSPESVIRIIKKFKEDKLISIEGKTFKILDIEKLSQISEKG